MKKVFLFLLVFVFSASAQYFGYGGGNSKSVWSKNGDDIYYNSGNVGIGTSTPATMLTLWGSSNKLRLSYDNSFYVDWYCDSGGNLLFDLNGTNRAKFSNGRWLLYEWGNFSLPSIAGLGDSNTGLALWGSDKLSIMTGGNHIIKVEADGDIVMTGITGRTSLPASPEAGTMIFLNANDADPDTIAVYNGTGWKYFISQ